MSCYTTDSLLKQITTIEEAIRFVEKECIEQPVDFHDHLIKILSKKSITIPVLIEASNINKNYCYNIINGTRKRPGRDKVLALCIGAQMDICETQETLDIAMTGRLCISNKRDIFIAYALNSKIGSVTRTNIILSENDIEPLDV